MNDVHYDATELAKMAIRNYNNASRECGGKPCGDPVACVAGVFAAPLSTLAKVENEYALLRKEKEDMRFALETAVANIRDLPPSVKEAFRKALPGHPHLN